MKWFYILLLVLIVSCGGKNDNEINNKPNTSEPNTSGTNDDETNEVNQNGNVSDPITQATAQTQFSGEEFFSIQRMTEEPVRLTFNKRSENPIEVFLEQNECIYISVSQYEDLLISTGDPLQNLCGFVTSCVKGSFKIVKGNIYNKRESIEKLDNCRSIAS